MAGLEFFETFLVNFLLMVEELRIELGSHILNIREEFESIDVWDIVDWEFILLENKAFIMYDVPCLVNLP